MAHMISTSGLSFPKLPAPEIKIDQRGDSIRSLPSIEIYSFPSKHASLRSLRSLHTVVLTHEPYLRGA